MKGNRKNTKGLHIFCTFRKHLENELPWWESQFQNEFRDLILFYFFVDIVPCAAMFAPPAGRGRGQSYSSWNPLVHRAAAPPTLRSEMRGVAVHVRNHKEEQSQDTETQYLKIFSVSVSLTSVGVMQSSTSVESWKTKFIITFIK